MKICKYTINKHYKMSEVERAELKIQLMIKKKKLQEEIDY